MYERNKDKEIEVAYEGRDTGKGKEICRTKRMRNAGIGRNIWKGRKM